LLTHLREQSSELNNLDVYRFLVYFFKVSFVN